MWDNPLLATFKIMVAATILIGLVCVPFLCTSQEETAVALLGLVCLTTVSVPMFIRKDYNLLEPLTLVILLILFGVPLKLLYVIAAQHSSYYVSLRLLDWGTPADFFKPMILVTLGWLLFTIGYSVPTRSKFAELLYLPQIRTWNQKRLLAVLVILMGISTVCLLAFMATAGVSLSNLSAKRFVEEGGSGGRIYDVKYYLLRGAALFKFVTYLALAWMICRRDRVLSLSSFMFVSSLLLTIFLSIVINNRAGIVLVIIDCLFISYFLGKITLKMVGLGALSSFVLLIPLLISRSQTETTLNEVIEKTLAGRDMLDITKTCQIINAIPRKLDYIYGETLYGWMLAPIPRSVWPDKPMWVERGPLLMQQVYNQKTTKSGIPPGLPAELYWNFSTPGMWIGLALMGLILRHLFLSFEPNEQNPTSVIIYTMIATRFGMFALGSDLGTGFVKAALDLVPLLLIFLWIGTVPMSSETDEEDEEEDEEDDDESLTDRAAVRAIA